MKRTEKLDGDKELLLFTQADGTPVWTTHAQIKLTRAELEEKAAKLKTARHFGKLQNVVGAVRTLVNAWLETVFEELTPESVREKGEQAVGEWIVAEGYSFHRDGLTWIVKRQGSVVVELPIDIDPSIREEVLFMMKMEEV